MTKHTPYEFETVSVTEIPPSKWGAAFWKRPSTIEFLEKIAGLSGDSALRLGFDTKVAVLHAHKNLQHRIKRATELGLLTGNFVITGRRQDGRYYLFLYKKELIDE